MTLQLAPSILSCSYRDMADSIQQMIDGGAEWIHYDVMDGQFVPPITFGAQLVKDMPKGTGLEAHLMTLTPERHFEAFIEAGCKRIIFHAEATMHAHRLVQDLHSRGVQAGLAINPGTPIEAAIPLLSDLDLVLVMTVNPGWGGQEFIEECLEKVRRVRELAPDLDIEVDGGIDPSTIGRAWGAGANVFVAGSFIARSSSIPGAMRELRSACGY